MKAARMNETTRKAIDAAFAKRLKDSLSKSDAASWSQTELAKHLNITSQQVNNYLTGRRMPSIAIARDLCALTGASFEWLLTGETPKGQKSLEEMWDRASQDERESLLARLLVSSTNK